MEVQRMFLFAKILENKSKRERDKKRGIIAKEKLRGS